MVVAAGHGGAAESAEALAILCQAYWNPIYVYARRRGFGPEDAEDLTQSFFAHLLATSFVGKADPARGRFRSYLLTAVNHFLADEWDRRKAAKRGGGIPTISLDAAQLETKYRLEPVDQLSPERAYEKRWALVLLDHVLEGLQNAYHEAGKRALFHALKSTLTQSRSAVPYAELAKELNLTEGALRVAVHRLRERYRELLRDEIARTVADPAEVEAELRHLFRVLAE